MRAADRNRLLTPLIASAALLAAYAFVNKGPLIVRPYGDVRTLLFGPDFRWLIFVAVVPLIFFCVRLVDLLAFDLVMGGRKRLAAPQILRAIVSATLYCLLFAWVVAEIFHYSVTAWLAVPTVLAAVLGLALQETLGNLASGIALHFEETFSVGDLVQSGDYIGVIENISWRAIRVRTFNNTFAILPNSQLARDRIEVFPQNNLNGRKLLLTIDYHVAPAKVIDVLVRAASQVDGVSREIPCRSRVTLISEQALTYEVKYFVNDYSQRDRIDGQILKAVWYALQRNDIPIAVPVRSYKRYTEAEPPVHVEEPEIQSRLRSISLLQHLDPEAVPSLAHSLAVHVYGRGETIIQQGHAGDSMFIVHSGLVSVRRNDTAGKQHEVAQLGPGEVFGEMALLTGEVRQADVVASQETIAFEITKAVFQPLMEGNPELAAAMASEIAQRESRLEALSNEAVALKRESLLSRVRHYFRL